MNWYQQRRLVTVQNREPWAQNVKLPFRNGLIVVDCLTEAAFSSVPFHIESSLASFYFISFYLPVLHKTFDIGYKNQNKFRETQYLFSSMQKGKTTCLDGPLETYQNTFG